MLFSPKRAQKASTVHRDGCLAQHQVLIHIQKRQYGMVSEFHDVSRDWDRLDICIICCVSTTFGRASLSIAIRHSFKTEFETVHSLDMVSIRSSTDFSFEPKNLAETPKILIDVLWFQPVFTVFIRICHRGFPTDWT